ncbi:MAG: 30S ribosomal protein S5 [Alphaproteobacteria bacterium MarineAlpha5_Bin11]|nr:30S ribosomal protein S5 [Pelagibacteraceae bacterium]PPR43503.1 MAG: 30S ribosomal protein S5 [Alphaproteobacteria bacterium MarineAlpha5_Bin11]PPR51753.1 MAG: 30S ribosomal protein S5 [Alphaproteobacteria bacterium MarineAlpha5_Bin10]
MKDKENSDIVEHLVAVNRVAKVVKGGRRFGFAAIVVAGDTHGKVGYGTGKAKEVPNAIKKAANEAKKNLFRVNLKEERTVYHDAVGRFGAGRVIVRSAPPGTGVIAGGAMRAIFDSLGIKDVVAKSVGSANPHNVIKATFNAFNNIASPKSVAGRRSKKVSDIIVNTKKA